MLCPESMEVNKITTCERESHVSEGEINSNNLDIEDFLNDIIFDFPVDESQLR